MIKTASLTPFENDIVYHKHTELPNTGRYDNYDKAGTYLCRNCGIALFRSKDKFYSGCGWPSFDGEVSDNVKHVPDIDLHRTEILCKRCDAHLGHVFLGENFTTENIRHCVNSASLDFVSDLSVSDTEETILAAGCFWGVEYYLQKLPGVLKTEVGYSGGALNSPTYKDVCASRGNHLEVIRVIYDHNVIDYAQVLKYFFEIHDFTQINGQGPDIGSQYLSAVFYYDNRQKEIALQIIEQLTNRGYKVATTIRPVSTFWVAEDYHQNYYICNNKEPYCHSWQKKF